MGKIKYLCPKCFKISDKVRAVYFVIEADTYKNGGLINAEEVARELKKLSFDCGCENFEYEIKDVEVMLDDEDKVMRIHPLPAVKRYNAFNEFEETIKEKNPEYKNFKIVWN